jgi:hypothetical protein
MSLSARQQMLSEFRKSARHSEYARWWLGQYESKMLVSSAPPLTQGVADYWTQLRLWALDIPATVEQYLEYQEVLIEAWKTAASRDREGVVNAAQYARTIAGLSVDKQHLVRARLRGVMVDELHSSSVGPEERGYWRATRRRTHRGACAMPCWCRASRNLRSTWPPLTRITLEWLLDCL